MGKYDDLGATIAPPQGEAPDANKYADLGATPAAQATPDYSSLGATPAPKVTAQELAQQDHSSIFQHAAQHPEDFETAYQADKQRRARPLLTKIGEGIASTPAALVHGAQGLWNFGRGVLWDIPANTVAAAYRGATGDTRGLTNQAQSTLAAQHGEETLKNLGHAIYSMGPSGSSATAAGAGYGDYGGDITPDYTPEERAAQDDQKQRALFAQRVQQAKNEIQLAQGKPLDTGAIAGIYHVGGQEPTAEVGPEALRQAGVDQVNPAAVSGMSAASDPTMIALAAAPGLPGARAIGGGATELAGKALQAPGKALNAVTQPFARTANAFHALHAIANPAHAAVTAAKKGGIRGLGAIGEALEAQGKEMRTGLPSQLTTEAATASATGESAIGANIQRKIGDAAAHGATTAVGMAPLNAVLAQGDPQALAESTAGAGVFGGTLGALARNRPLLVEAVRPHLQSEGARALAEASDANDPLAIKSAAYVMSLPEEARNSVLQTIGALQGLPATQGDNPQRAKIYVLNDADYTKAIEDNFGKEQAAAGGGRGFFLTQEGKAFVNGDYHSGLDPSQLNHTVGHEFGGHAAINVMQAMGAKGGALYNGLVNSVRAKLMPNGRPSADFYRFVREYNHAFDKTGETQRLSFNDPEAIEEYIAETAGQIMAGRGAGELALPQTVQDKFNQGIGQFMGKFIGLDPRKVGTPTNFGREEVGALTQAVQDTLGQVVGMKLRGGAEIPEPAKTDTRRISELQDVLNTPRPKLGSALTDVQQWIAQQKSARSELSQLQGQQTGAFPASGQPPVPPSTPRAPNVPATQPAPSRASVAAALRLNGIPAAEAQQWANAAEGATTEQMVLDALKKRAGQKFPSQPPPAQTPPNQPSVLPPAAIEPIPNEQPAPASNENGALPPGRTGIQEQAGQGVAPTEPIPIQVPEHLEQVAAQAREQFLSDKEPAKSGKNKGQHTAANLKAAEKAAFDAAAAAHAQTVPENYQGLRQRTDAFGKTTVSGTVDPSRPFDAWLIKQATDSGHLTPDSLKTLLALQDSIGKTVSYDYGHAPAIEEGDMPTKEGRAAQQAEHTVAKRLAGESPMQTERKTSVPLRIEFNSGTKSFTVYGASQEKLLNNFNHLSEKMSDLGIPTPFRDINDPRFVAAFKAIIRNQEHGWTGDGKRPSVGTEEFPNRPDPDWKTNPEHQLVPDDEFQFVNALLADEGAKPPKRGDATISKAKAHLANENERLLNAEGETNPLRQKINDAEPGWTKATLEDPLNENISPALASNLGPASRSDESIRVHGKVGDLSRFFDKGQTPNRAKTAAGFLPDTGAPKTQAEQWAETNGIDLDSDDNSLSGVISALKTAIQKDPLNGEREWREAAGKNPRMAQDYPDSFRRQSAMWSRRALADAKKQFQTLSMKENGGSDAFRFLDKTLNTAYGSRYYQVDHGGDWFSVRIADHKNTASGRDSDFDQLRGAKLTTSRMDRPHVVNVVISEPVKNEAEAKLIIKKVLDEMPKSARFRDAGNGNDVFVDFKGDKPEYTFKDSNGNRMDDVLGDSKTTQEKARERIEFAGKSKSEEPDRIQMANGSVTKGAGAMFLPAFHGTPHKVDKFSAEKIGTGEGAQVYGHGLYFAENPKVADEYRKNLSGRAVGMDTPIGELSPLAQKIVREGPMDKGATIKTWHADLERKAAQAQAWAEQGHNKESNSSYADAVKEVIDATKNARLEPDGNAYTVDIDAKPEELLDWDKPLSEQPQSVQDAMKSLGANGDETGSEAHHHLTHRMGGIDEESGAPSNDKSASKKVSDMLKKAGIVGIQYLDQGSRFAGHANVELREENSGWTIYEAGKRVMAFKHESDARMKVAEMTKPQTRNFVVFDDSRIKITHDNGQTVTREERREALGQQSPQDAAKARLSGGKTATGQFMPDSTPAPEEGKAPEGQEPSGSQPNRLSTGGTSLKTLYRASNNDDAKSGAHFSENEADAKQYQTNPGFGGSKLQKFKVDASRVADVATLRDLASTLEPMLNEDQRQWAEENGGFLSAMKGMGYDHTFHAIENSFGPRGDKIDPVELLSKDHDWVRFTDDFPEGAKTWRYIGDKRLTPEIRSTGGTSTNDSGYPEDAKFMPSDKTLQDLDHKYESAFQEGNIALMKSIMEQASGINIPTSKWSVEKTEDGDGDRVLRIDLGDYLVDAVATGSDASIFFYPKSNKTPDEITGTYRSRLKDELISATARLIYDGEKEGWKVGLGHQNEKRRNDLYKKIITRIPEPFILDENGNPIPPSRRRFEFEGNNYDIPKKLAEAASQFQGFPDDKASLEDQIRKRGAGILKHYMNLAGYSGADQTRTLSDIKDASGVSDFPNQNRVYPNSDPAKFLPDTGTPAEGETSGERLMREAEAAGLAPSLETMKGILRGDTQAMDKLRRAILERTGRPARFLPGTQQSAKEAARARIQSRVTVPADDRKRVLVQPR